MNERDVGRPEVDVKTLAFMLAAFRRPVIVESAAAVLQSKWNTDGAGAGLFGPGYGRGGGRRGLGGWV